MMPGERPVVVLVFAILNIVFGILGSLCAVCSGLSAALVTGVFSAAGPGLSFPSLPSAVIAVSIVDCSIMLLLAIALTFAGIGLLGMKAWARRLCIVLSALGILYSVVSPIVAIAYTNPKMEKWQTEFQEQIDKQKRGAQRPPPISIQTWQSPTVSAVEALLMSVLIIAYAITMLVFMLRRDVAAAFVVNGMRSRVEWEDKPQDHPGE